jgi:hypothetical protein
VLKKLQLYCIIILSLIIPQVNQKNKRKKKVEGKKMKGRVIGVAARGDFTNDKGVTYPAAATFYVVRKNSAENAIGEVGDEVKVSCRHPLYNDLLLGTDTFAHALGAVIDYSFEASQYKKLADAELISYINADGEVINYAMGVGGPALYETSKSKAKASA